MLIYSVFILSKGGSLIYDMDFTTPKPDAEQTFSYPLDIVLKVFDDKLTVDFGARDSIRDDQSDVEEYLADEGNYPISLKFGRPKLSSNDKIMLASMFHSFFAFGCQLSPEEKSSGIQMLETDTFKLHCKQTLTGIKFVLLTDPKLGYVESLLRTIYELYADYALKNPYYAVDMPIRYDLFDQHLKAAIENFEKAGIQNS